MSRVSSLPRCFAAINDLHNKLVPKGTEANPLLVKYDEAVSKNLLPERDVEHFFDSKRWKVAPSEYFKKYRSASCNIAKKLDRNSDIYPRFNWTCDKTDAEIEKENKKGKVETAQFLGSK